MEFGRLALLDCDHVALSSFGAKAIPTLHLALWSLLRSQSRHAYLLG
jgi:hypothetical protein